MTTPKADIYSRITNKIIAALEQGVRPWTQPWNSEHVAGRITRPLRASGEPYQGINVLTLWCDAAEKGFASPVWITFKQALALGACVRKGEKGSPVVYADRMTKKETDACGDETERSIPFLKGYTVFNCEQIEGLPQHFYAKPQPMADSPARIEAVEKFIAATNATIRNGGLRAFHSITGDFVQLPPLECFRDAESYYATLLHELTHWTRHASRLNREFGRKRWGDEGYATEELVAELGAAFLCADLGVTPEVQDNHAQYIASWLKVLENDNRAIFTAAAHAQRAADFLMGLQQKVTTDTLETAA